MFLELVVQFIWTAFLIRILLPREGRSYAALFLSPAYFWLLYISIAFLLLFMFVTLYKLLSDPPGKPLKNAFLYLLIPVIFFPIAKNARLGSSSVNRRNIEGILAESDTGNVVEKGASSQAYPILNPADSQIEYLNTDGTTRITDILRLDESFMGTEVEITGIAEFNDILQAEVFICTVLSFSAARRMPPRPD